MAVVPGEQSAAAVRPGPLRRALSPPRLPPATRHGRPMWQSLTPVNKPGRSLSAAARTDLQQDARRMPSPSRASPRPSSSPAGPRSWATEIAAHSQPEKSNGRAPWTDDTPEPGTLVLRVEGPAAIEIQHLSGVMLERVNRFFGWQAVGEHRGCARRRWPGPTSARRRPRPGGQPPRSPRAAGYRRRKPARRAGAGSAPPSNRRDPAASLAAGAPLPLLPFQDSRLAGRSSCKQSRQPKDAPCMITMRRDSVAATTARRSRSPRAVAVLAVGPATTGRRHGRRRRGAGCRAACSLARSATRRWATTMRRSPSSNMPR